MRGHQPFYGFADSPVAAGRAGDILGDGFQFVAGVRDGDADPAGSQDRIIGQVVPDGADMRGVDLKLVQHGLEGDSLVPHALHDDGDAEFARAAVHGGGLAAGDDRHLAAALLPKLDGRPVPDVEGFDLVPGVRVGDAAVRQHAVHVQDQEADGPHGGGEFRG